MTDPTTAPPPAASSPSSSDLIDLASSPAPTPPRLPPPAPTRATFAFGSAPRPASPRRLRRERYGGGVADAPGSGGASPPAARTPRGDGAPRRDAGGCLERDALPAALPAASPALPADGPGPAALDLTARSSVGAAATGAAVSGSGSEGPLKSDASDAPAAPAAAALPLASPPPRRAVDLTEFTPYRSGWSKPPSVRASSFGFLPPSGDRLGETGVQRAAREAREAFQRQEEAAAKQAAEAAAEAERERLDRVVREQDRKNEELQQEIMRVAAAAAREREAHEEKVEARRAEAARAAVAALAAAPAAPPEDDLEKIEEGEAVLDETLETEGEGWGQEEATSPESGVGERRRMPPWLWLLLLLLIAAGVAIAATSGGRSEEGPVRPVALIGLAAAANATAAPSDGPSAGPTTRNPTTGDPTATPTRVPTPHPTGAPSWLPTGTPTGAPTETPTADPSRGPTTRSPTGMPVVASTLIIEAADAALADGGGTPNAVYAFALTAGNLPAGVAEVRFEWSPGAGAPGSAVAPVVDGAARAEMAASYPAAGTYALAAAVYAGREELAAGALDVVMAGTTLAIDPPGLTAAVALENYAFNFVADNIPTGVDVQFTWTFGVGDAGTGVSDTVSARDGRARASASQLYALNGTYSLVAEVRDAATAAVLAESSAAVNVGRSMRRDFALDACDGAWSEAYDTGEGVTVDDWDVSAVPVGAVFDLTYQAYKIPDRFLVDYPVGNRVLDTGWVGSARYDGSPQYPGGVTGVDAATNRFTVHDAFARLSHEVLRVTVVGPWPSKGWGYEVRCREPRLAAGAACAAGADDAACPAAACGHAGFGATSPTVCCATGGARRDMGLVPGWPSRAASEGGAALVLPARWDTHCQGMGKRKCERDPLCSYAPNACEPAADIITASWSTWEAYCGNQTESECRGDTLCGYYDEDSEVCHPTNWHHFCTSQTDGALCGDFDELCASNACVGGRCVGPHVDASVGSEASAVEDV